MAGRSSEFPASALLNEVDPTMQDRSFSCAKPRTCSERSESTVLDFFSFPCGSSRLS